MTVRDSESVLDRLEAQVARKATLFEADEPLDVVQRNHLRALLDVARAAERHRDALDETFDRDDGWTDEETGEWVSMPSKVRRMRSDATWQPVRDALAPLTTPSEQTQTESESRGVAPPCKGVEEGSA